MKRLSWIVLICLVAASAIAYYIRVDVSAAPTQLTFDSVSRGDVIAIKLAGPHVLYVKRIIALPGERVAFIKGQVFVNGAALAEPYVRDRRLWDVPEVQLTGREYFVVGDNRGMRASDHDFGRVDVSRIIGKLLF